MPITRTNNKTDKQAVVGKGMKQQERKAKQRERKG